MNIYFACNLPSFLNLVFRGGKFENQLWQETQAFSETLEKMRHGPLPYARANNLGWGTSWNRPGEGLESSFQHWAERRPGIWVAATVEIPYAVVDGQTVTEDGARAFGHDLARAVRVYLATRGEKEYAP